MSGEGLDLADIQRDKLAMLGQLTAGVAHELNNPIGYIASNIGTLGRYLQLLTELIQACETTLPSEQWQELSRQHKWQLIQDDLPELLQETREGSEHLKALVADLKTLGRSSTSREPVDPNHCIVSALNVLNHRLKHGFIVHRELAELPQVEVVRAQIIQALTNLLHNSIQALGEQGGEILVASRLVDGQVEIAVEDSGPGVPPALQEQIFSPYFTTKPACSGTGLGLAIVAQIIRDHAGHILYQSGSRLGGARFLLTLPVPA